MAEIKVNMENLKDNEREQLLALIEKANKKPKRFKPEKKSVYWFVNRRGETDFTSYYNSPEDLWGYNVNNCFETKEEAKFELEKRKVIAELETFALENDDEIDWSDDNQTKYCLYCDHREGTLEIDYAFYCQTQGGIYFSSEELCEQAIGKVGADRIKKYLFGVEE